VKPVPVIDVALVHHPVRDRRGETITTAINNVDVHDIARSCRTYGVRVFHVVTPITAQQAIAERILVHWREGEGATRLPERGDALDRVRIAASIEDVVAGMTAELGERPTTIVTSAAPPTDRVWLGHSDAAARLRIEGVTLLVLGNGHGLTDDVMQGADEVLAPIVGVDGYNHLSVRAAAAILLDRLLRRDA
jgi:hypothetical protein